jgi:hypothetical protein
MIVFGVYVQSLPPKEVVVPVPAEPVVVPVPAEPVVVPEGQRDPMVKEALDEALKNMPPSAEETVEL